MTTSGKLNPGLAGANIVVRYTPPARGSRSSGRSPPTRNGNWSDSIVPSDDGSPNGRPNRGAGDWLIEPRFEGDAGHAGSTAQACTVTVFDSI